MLSASCLRFDCSGLVQLVQEERSGLPRLDQLGLLYFPPGLPMGLCGKGRRGGGCWRGSQGAIGGRGNLGVEGCFGGQRGGCTVLSLRSANLDSGRNFLWFIQRELLHLYKLEPAKCRLSLSLHTHTHTHTHTHRHTRSKRCQNVDSLCPKRSRET